MKFHKDFSITFPWSIAKRNWANDGIRKKNARNSLEKRRKDGKRARTWRKTLAWIVPQTKGSGVKTNWRGRTEEVNSGKRSRTSKIKVARIISEGSIENRTVVISWDLEIKRNENEGWREKEEIRGVSEVDRDDIEVATTWSWVPKGRNGKAWLRETRMARLTTAIKASWNRN